MIFHGKTFTSKVSLRQVCAAIKKYGFVASPYPIIISAEMHCSLPQQGMVAQIMVEVFEDALIREPPEGMPRIEKLPSPEDLRGKILFKVGIFDWFSAVASRSHHEIADEEPSVAFGF